ncbi:MAG TPA: serine hydrolase domain-containing protein [Streptosporangiaceae bacterium]|nr:serine hydrolase domain-containing protein [Streptosporangiaceae bacterium]
MRTSRIDEIAARFAARGGQPGVAFGIVAGGELVHGGGLGERFAGGPAPDVGTVFRIASMTKSFTASAILALRDAGDLRLDDRAEAYLPELRGLQLPAADCPPVTIRQLLTMTAGFPTDDPWGDRQQGLAAEAFAALLAGGEVRCCWAPGTRFEYSNLGYAILGRVIAAVTGSGYETATRRMLLRPLAMDSTGFEAGEFDPATLAGGYRWDGSGWLEVQPDPSGAFAPMGGIFSCVTDLARWVAGFAAAFPARDGADASPHPLSRATRREMQLPQVAVADGLAAPAVRIGGPASVSYGFGLFSMEDPAFGTIIQHSGGYPGYGSQMRWHPQTGLGAVVLANSTYAGAGALAAELLAALLADRGAAATRPVSGRLAGSAPAPGGPWPETVAARQAVDELLADWDDSAAGRLFAPNVALDRPLAQRRADVALLRERIGEFRPDPGRPAEFDSPAHCRWWLTGEHGTACVQIRLAPLRKPLVQQLVLAVPPGPGSALDLAIRLLSTELNDGGRDWPPELDTAVSTAQVLRQLRLAAAWAGRCVPGAWLAGNGATTASLELTGPDGKVSLTVEVDGHGQRLQRADCALLPPG